MLSKVSRDPVVSHPMSRVRFGIARRDITPPVGIYHPMWGAARHHRATGVHRPLYADVMAFGDPAGKTSNCTLLRAHLDLVYLSKSQCDELRSKLSARTSLSADQVEIAFSHTHAAGLFHPERIKLPGGELIPEYIDDLEHRVMDGAEQAIDSMEEVWVTYGVGSCRLAADRDFWDAKSNRYVCGFNPKVSADDTLLLARVTRSSGELVATIVNYGCHPTTLAWENTLISPDYVGAMREEVEHKTDAPCVFALGACGDLGPRRGFVGDPSVADQNGREVAYAALSALESLPPPAAEYRYQGPVISGATLGVWSYAPLSAQRVDAASTFAGGAFSAMLPLRERPDPQTLERDMQRWKAEQKRADERGDRVRARDLGAYIERARRWLARLDTMPAGPEYPLYLSAYRIGDALWVSCGGEPYNWIQTELRRRYPSLAIMFSPLTNDTQVGYLLLRNRYGLGLYQEEPSILGPGCLEAALEAIVGRIETALYNPART